MRGVHELEAALQASWDRDTLAVYADALQTRGDPRGELIAIDLLIDEHGREPALCGRRAQLLDGWLGDAFREHRHRFRYGLLQHYTITRTQNELRRSAIAPLTRELCFANATEHAYRDLAKLADRPLPWLRALAIDTMGNAIVPVTRTLEALAGVAPHLTELALSRSTTIATPGPASLRKLRLAGCDSVIVTAAAMPQITELALVLHGDPRRLAALVNPRLFPALACLDLSANEPAPGTLQMTPVAFAGTLEDFARVRVLRLPSVRGGGAKRDGAESDGAKRDGAESEGVESEGVESDDDEARAVVELLARFPDLVIEIARTYKHTLLDDVRDPRLHVPPPRHWLPADVVGGEMLRIQPIGVELMLYSLIESLEARHADLHARDRTAWDAFWDALRELAWVDAADEIKAQRMAFDAVTLADLLETLPDNTDCSAAVTAMRAAGVTTVTLERDQPF